MAIRLATMAAASLAAAGLALAAAPAAATGLLDTWRAAREHDREFAAARAAWAAGQARRAQAVALWRPTVQASATAGLGTAETSATGARFAAPGFGTSEGVAFDTSVTGGTATRWGIAAQQPLVSRERDAQRRQLELAAEMAELQWQDAQAALALRAAERHFEVALADEQLQVLRRQLEAVRAADVEAQDRFRIGDVPVTDTLEARARLEALSAQVLAAETELRLRRAALADLTGIAPEAQAIEAPRGEPALPPAPPLERSLEEAALRNPGVRLQALAVEVARAEAARQDALGSPTLDLVARVGRDRIWGSGAFGAASNSATNALLGVQLAVPLYTGGMREAKLEEASRLADKAAAEADRARQQAQLAARGAWLGLTAGSARIAALAAGLQAAEARLDATRTGRQVGDRTTLELLAAENDAAAARLALAQARVARLLDTLRLAAITGQLDEAGLQAVDAALRAAQQR